MTPRRLLLLPALVGSLLAAQGPDQCTAAVISPGATAGARPMLWKNRDTGELSNRVVLVKEQPYSYLGVVNKEDPTGRIVWAGLNDAGFAIMNTASYNLPQKKDEQADMEGQVMAHALRTCRTVADFEAFLKANLSPSLGVSTNFGVIDAQGGAVVFEVHNHGIQKYDAAQAPRKFLFVTNFSRSGDKDKGAGRLRMDRAEELFGSRATGNRATASFTPRDIFRDFSRDTGHSLLKTPAWPAFKNVEGPTWVHTRHTINRWDTACAVVLVGKDPAKADSRPVMWILPGEPLLSVALPLWVEAGAPPEAFWKGKEAPLWAETLRLKALARPTYGQNEKQEYLDISRLDNRQGTGFLPALLAAEDTVFSRTDAFLATPRKPEELKAFQEEMAGLAMKTLGQVK